MMDWLRRGGLPAQYGALGLAGGLLALALSPFVGFFAQADLGTVIACAAGGALGGWVREWTQRGG
jgi:hypothetical protein